LRNTFSIKRLYGVNPGSPRIAPSHRFPKRCAYIRTTTSLHFGMYIAQESQILSTKTKSITPWERTKSGQRTPVPGATTVGLDPATEHPLWQWVQHAYLQWTKGWGGDLFLHWNLICLDASRLGLWPLGWNLGWSVLCSSTLYDTETCSCQLECCCIGRTSNRRGAARARSLVFSLTIGWVHAL
jgi:hypothetical protein